MLLPPAASSMLRELDEPDAGIAFFLHPSTQAHGGLSVVVVVAHGGLRVVLLCKLPPSELALRCEGSLVCMSYLLSGCPSLGRSASSWGSVPAT